MPDDNFYMPLRGYDNESSVSRVNNHGLESGGIYEDTVAPELPKRDYQNPTIVVQEGLVKKTSSKKTRAPQPPVAPIDQMDSIQREKTVCLETQFQRDHQPKGRDKLNDDNKKEMPGKMNIGAPNGESRLAYIQRFRRELFRKDGFTVEVDKTDLSPKTMKLVCVADCICIAALPDAKLHSLLHVDDVIVKVNRQTLPSIDFCYTLFRTTDENKVQLHVKRVMHGILCHVILSANGDIDSLGLEFGNQSQGNEVTAMHSDGLVAKSCRPSRPQTHGVVSGGVLVNWGLIEINQSPVSFDSSPADVRDQLQRAGIELVLVFIPMDLINVFKEGPCGESTDQTSVCAAGATTEAEKNDDDNIPERVQSDGTDSVETIDHAIDGRSATGKFGSLGGKLSTKSHGLTLHIPPGALEEDGKISLVVLTDIPEGLTLNKDELLVSHGFQCYPSGLRFKKTAKLIIPHCALVTAPNNVKTILYSWNQSGTPKRLTDPDSIICSVQERWLEVSISHFSGGFIALILDWLFLKGMLLSCMSFLPRLMPPSRKPILEVRFAKKPHGQKWNDVHAYDKRFQPVKGDDDDIVFREKTITVACQHGEKSPKLDVHVPDIPYSDMRSKTKVIAYFPLDLTDESDETLVTLEVVQTSIQTIKFNTSFQGIGERFTEQDTPSPSNVEIPSDGQKVTDEYILDIAKRLPPYLWNDLYVALRIDHSSAEGIRDKYRDITDGYVHLLHKWRAASTRTRHDLEAILITAGAGGLVNNNEPSP